MRRERSRASRIMHGDLYYVVCASIGDCALLYSQDQQSTVTIQTSEDELDLGNGWSVNYSFIASDIRAAAKGKEGYLAVGHDAPFPGWN